MNKILQYFFIVVVFSSSIAEGLKCYQCVYIKGAPNIPGEYPNHEKCKKDPPKDYEQECTADATVFKFINMSIAQANEGFSCGKAVAKANDIEAVGRGCIPNFKFVTDNQGKCNTKTAKEIITEVGGTWDPTYDDYANVKIETCFCDKDKCNSAIKIHSYFSGVLAIFLVFFGYF